MSTKLNFYEVLSFIEDNIKDQLTTESIANYAGYSKFHFSRLFKSEFGISINEYIIERRLMNASIEILNGQRIIDVALNYGYGTHSGFTRAFKKKFGYPPKVLCVFSFAEIMFNPKGEKVMDQKTLYNCLIKKLDQYVSDDEISQVKSALEYAIKCHEGYTRYSGEPYIIHPLEVALLLVEMKQPIETIILGILHDIYNSKYSSADEHAHLSFGISVHEKLIQLSKVDINEALLECSEDIILVKLADRLHNMRTIEHLSKERWSEKAKETLSLFSPLARKLEIPELKMELDHLSIKYIECNN